MTLCGTAGGALVAVAPVVALYLALPGAGPRACAGSDGLACAVCASMLPFQLVQLAVASSGLVVVSRRPPPRPLSRRTRWFVLILVGSIVVIALAVRRIPSSLAMVLLREN